MRDSALKFIVLIVLGVFLVAPSAGLRAGDADANPLPEIKADPAEWKTMIEGTELAGWKKPAGLWETVGEVTIDPADEKKLIAKPGNGILYNGPKGRTQDIFSTAEFGDCAVHIEFMVSKNSNSGVYFQGAYELQILDSFGIEKSDHPGGECGGLYQRWDPARGKGNEGFEGHSPSKNVSRAPGEWQSFDVIFQAPKFDDAGKKIADAKFIKVVHNGTVVHENVELHGSTRGGGPEKAMGPFRLQGDHGPVAFRNFKVLPMKK